LRQRILAGAKSDWAIERARWGRTFRWATVLLALAFAIATWSERGTADRLAQIQRDVENGRREQVIVLELANAIPEGTDAYLRRYLARQALAPPKPRPRVSDSIFAQTLDAT
jgi:hypothetical protein